MLWTPINQPLWWFSLEHWCKSVVGRWCVSVITAVDSEQCQLGGGLTHDISLVLGQTLVDPPMCIIPWQPRWLCVCVYTVVLPAEGMCAERNVCLTCSVASFQYIIIHLCVWRFNNSNSLITLEDKFYSLFYKSFINFIYYFISLFTWHELDMSRSNLRQGPTTWNHVNIH